MLTLSGCMHHDITENFECILIELGAVSVINHIQMSLKEGEVEEDEEDEDDEDKSHSISYFIEVSGDMTNWHRVIDHSNYKCRSLQDLYFPCRTVRYIRLVGTGTTAEKKVSYITIDSVLGFFSNANKENWAI